ncbi:MAG TPA: carboxypeptidase-like regulatory domain-containing protein [Vicinamibacterales bacterium]|nr:carboxypeptidase-like regulatory domain-containing protein [Vicinamibacterales bacterium]
MKRLFPLWFVIAMLSSGIAIAQGARATLSGTVLAPSGSPQGYVTLVVTNAAGIDRRAVSDPDGGFVFGGLAPGTYRLRVDDETFAPWSTDAVTLAPGERRTVQIALQPRIVAQTRATIAGTVFGPDGRTRGGAVVILTNPAGIDRRAVSEPTGAYVFGGLAPGSYRIRVDETGAQPLAIDGLALVAGERRLVDLRLQPIPTPAAPPPAPSPTPTAPTPGAGPQKIDVTARKKAEPSKPGLPPPVTADDGSFEAKPDRWHFPWPAYQRYSPPEKMPWVTSAGPLDPYNQNAMKGDFPIGGGDHFVNMTLQFNNNTNPRQVELGALPQQQLFYNQNLVGGLELFKGDTVFQPKDWAVRATAVLNINAATLDNSFSFGSLQRKPTKYSLEEAFAEKRLAVLGPAFDFVSIRAGMQNFNSDFRGYVFEDNQLGVRLFGNARSNRDQYNVAYFSMRNRDAASQLHDFGSRNQDVIIANYYIQDFGAPGYTAMFNVHVNRDRGPAADPTALQAIYLGVHGDGRAGGWAISHAFYQVLGTDDNNHIRQALNGNQRPAPVDINARMAALELSRDADWKRYRVSLFYASGDDGADATKAKGFDSIMDNPNLAGGQFMFWTQQATNVSLTAGNSVLSDKFSLVPSLRSKFLDRSNFVNPGLILINGGVDVRLSPQIKLVTNASYLRFADATILRALRPANTAGFEDNELGIDISAGAKIRPFTNENLFLVVGVSGLKPRGGFATALGPGGSLYSFFTAFQVAY